MFVKKFWHISCLTPFSVVIITNNILGEFLTIKNPVLTQLVHWSKNTWLTGFTEDWTVQVSKCPRMVLERQKRESCRRSSVLQILLLSALLILSEEGHQSNPLLQKKQYGEDRFHPGLRLPATSTSWLPPPPSSGPWWRTTTLRQFKARQTWNFLRRWGRLFFGSSTQGNLIKASSRNMLLHSWSWDVWSPEAEADGRGRDAGPAWQENQGEICRDWWNLPSGETLRGSAEDDKNQHVMAAQLGLKSFFIWSDISVQEGGMEEVTKLSKDAMAKLIWTKRRRQLRDA